MILRISSLLPFHRMGIVEPNLAFAVRPVQRERVVDAVRLLRRDLHPRHHEPDPMAALRVHHENLPVEVEQHIEGRIAWLSHGI